MKGSPFWSQQITAFSSDKAGAGVPGCSSPASVPAHVLQQGAPAVAAVVEVVVGLPMVVVGAPLAAAPAFLPGRRHLEEHVPAAGRGPQDPAGREWGGGEAARREAG